MRRMLSLLLITGWVGSLIAQSLPLPVFHEYRNTIRDKKELTFIGYYLVRHEMINVAPKNEFFKGQVVGRLFRGNSTYTMGSGNSNFTEQRFLGMLSYSPRLFDGWLRMRMSFEIDWTWGDANYGAGGNFGGGFGADFVNMQTQNLFMEFHPNKQWYVNMGLLRLYDNNNVPMYTSTDVLLNTGYRLALWGSDATGVEFHYAPTTYRRLKWGAYQLYENNVNQNDDVILYELDMVQDLSIKTTVGLSTYYLVDDGSTDQAGGEGGVSIYNQGLNSGLADYNGVFKMNLATNETYNARIGWLGTHFDHDPLLEQGRFGYSGFAWYNFGTISTSGAATDSTTSPITVHSPRDISIGGFASNLRLAYKYGKNSNDNVTLDGFFVSGDDNNVEDNKYSGVLTGNNWTSPGAVFFGTGMDLLLPHGDVVNRYYAATIDLQNMGWGLIAGVGKISYDLIPHKLRLQSAVGYAISPVAPQNGGHNMGFEKNIAIFYTPRVFLNLEFHLAHLSLGDFYDSPATNGGITGRPTNPWTGIVLLKWIMF